MNNNVLIAVAAVAGAVLGRLTAPRRRRIAVVLAVPPQHAGWQLEGARAVAEADRILRGER